MRYAAQSRVVLNQPAQIRLIPILGVIMIMYKVSTPSRVSSCGPVRNA
jgi:hypothetical protein